MTLWWTRLRAAWQVLRIGVLPAPVTLPAADAAFLVGQRSIEVERSALVEQQLDRQRAMYVKASKAELVDALIDRDRLLAMQGRQLADGRAAGKHLKEIVRAVLTVTEDAARQTGGYRPPTVAQVQATERRLQAIGAEGEDLRAVGRRLGEG